MTKDHVPFEESYLGQLRQLVGSRPLITPSARAILRDDGGRVLFIRRRANDTWGVPAGFMELDESILDCLKQEVREETGLEVLEATPIALYTEPRFVHTTASGEHIQVFAVVFRVDCVFMSCFKSVCLLKRAGLSGSSLVFALLPLLGSWG